MIRIDATGPDAGVRPAVEFPTPVLKASAPKDPPPAPPTATGEKDPARPAGTRSRRTQATEEDAATNNVRTRNQTSAQPTPEAKTQRPDPVAATTAQPPGTSSGPPWWIVGGIVALLAAVQ